MLIQKKRDDPHPHLHPYPHKYPEMAATIVLLMTVNVRGAGGKESRSRDPGFASTGTEGPKPIDPRRAASALGYSSMEAIFSD